MWVPKSESEKREFEEKRAKRDNPKDLTKPFLIAVAMALFIAVMSAAGYRGKTRPTTSALSAQEWFTYVPKHAGVAFLIFFPLAIVARRRGFWGREKEYFICTACFTPQEGNTERKCSCGGSIDEIWRWKWRPD